jgi:predicted GH43/DUF377 family glycosyl hydrolase
VTYIAELSMFFMTYTAYGPTGPRIALAVSDDLLEWERVGLVQLERLRGVDFSAYDNKDALIFPELVSDPQGKPALALIHRPTYQYYWVGASVLDMVPQGVDDARPSMWLSYCSIEQLDHGLKRPVRFSSHRLLAAPDASWQTLKVGGGTPPIRTRHGWLTLFHGVSGRMVDGTALQPFVRYAAGALVLAIDDPSTVVFRTKDPILEPLTRQERDGIVPNVVFPTGIDQRGEGIVDVYYGMADARIGVGRLRVPDILPVTTGSLPQAEEAIA